MNISISHFDVNLRKFGKLTGEYQLNWGDLFIKYLVLSFTLNSVHYIRNRKVNTS